MKDTPERLIETRLACDACKAEHVVALPEDSILRDVLATLACAACGAVGTSRLARTKVPL